MDELWTRIWEDLVTRTTGPMWFRLYLQPLVAIVLGVRAGLASARRRSAGDPDGGVLNPAHRRAVFHETLRNIGKVFVIGLALDAIFQVLALRTLYPGEAAVVALLLVVLPYQIVRVGVARLRRRP